MDKSHVFTPVILDLKSKIVFPEVLDLKGIPSRKPAADMLASPWYQYATRALSYFHADGVTEDWTSFTARMLAEAYEMGQHGMSLAAPGQPRAGYTTKGERVHEVRAAIKPGTRPTVVEDEPEPEAPEPVKGVATKRIVRGVKAAPEAPKKIVPRIVRRT